jgi:hypothetical protein
MFSLFAAGLFFLGIHFFISGTALRGKIVALIGEGPFRGVFSLISLIGIVWLVPAYSRAEYVQPAVWDGKSCENRKPAGDHCRYERNWRQSTASLRMKMRKRAAIGMPE